MLDGEYEPSTWDFAADHVERYEAGTDYLLQGAPCIVLWTRGAKSGKVRKSPLMRVEHEGRYAVVASMGGAPQHPTWYHNLVAHPDEVSLQDEQVLKDYRAREVFGDEKAEWWERAVAVWPSYADYQASTERQIPVFVLDPIG
jgi:deazaflavin-dependent oxidoreductase (nitroreductase family)